MPKYFYKGISYNGNEVSGEIGASNKDELKKILQKENIILLGCEKKVNTSQLQKIKFLTPPKELTAITRQIATMLEVGISLDRIMEIIIKQSKSPKLTKVFQVIQQDIKKGKGFSEALKVHPFVFNQLYVNLIKSGEASGTLTKVMKQLSDYSEKNQKTSQKIKSAFAYPLVILFVATMVLVILMVYIVPVFEEMFANFNAELPKSTQLVISISSFIVNNYWFIIIIMFALMILFLWVRTLDRVKSAINLILIRLPVIGNLVIKSQLTNFCLIMATLLSGGLTLKDSLHTALGAVESVTIKNIILRGIESITIGGSLNKVMKESKVIPPMMSEMIAIGEETGKLSFMFKKINDFYSSELETLIPTLTSILEPLLIVIMGVIVAAILISMYLPLFDLISQFG